MELINLERLLPKEILDKIDNYIKGVVGDDEYKIIYGQLFIGKEPPSNDFIITIVSEVVCDYFKVAKSIVLSTTRKQPYMKYRQIIAYLLLKYTDMNNTEIASALKYNNHSIITHIKKTIINYLRTDFKFSEDFNRIDDKLRVILINELK